MVSYRITISKVDALQNKVPEEVYKGLKNLVGLGARGLKTLEKAIIKEIPKISSTQLSLVTKAFESRWTLGTFQQLEYGETLIVEESPLIIVRRVIGGFVYEYYRTNSDKSTTLVGVTATHLKGASIL